MDSRLNKLFTYTSTVPEPQIAKAHLERLQTLLSENIGEHEAAIVSCLSPKREKEFQKLLSTSAFACEQLCARPQWFAQMLAEVDAEWEKAQYLTLFSHTEELSIEQWERHLRVQRNGAMARIIWRDFNRLADTRQTTAELTAMAEVAIQATLDFHYSRLCAEMGTPQDSEGQAQPLLVIGMGKLGAWELNLSSDIDLIFAYPSGGETQGGRKKFANQEFFTRLGQRIIKSLDQATPEGFVFRVDMRLRPYGQSGALVSSFDALEDYYQTQGREWERFAMIKARVVAHNGCDKAVDHLMSILRSFTYRGYVDFSAIDALRNLKLLINREVARRRLGENVKLGRGGIREVEFIAQAFQIIRGGRDTELQDRRLLHVLELLDKLSCLPPGVAQKLTEAYCFLRNVEHAIQGYRDQQSQELPRDKAGLDRIAMVLDCTDRDAFLTVLNQHRDYVHEQFSAVIATADDEEDDAGQQNLAMWRSLWLQLPSDVEDAAEQLLQLGFDDGEHAARLLEQDLLRAPGVVAMAAISRDRFDELMPRLLKGLAESAEPTQTLGRVLPLLKAVARRSAYLLLLSENPAALKQLVVLSEASPWIANQLAQHPALLDELLDPASLYSVPSKNDMAQELRQQLLRVEPHDLEAQMEALRYFRSAHALRVAACEATGQLPLMKVSDYLTELAEVILDHVLHLAWAQMVARHGYPDGEQSQEPAFVIIGYGKLGGIELGHGSDLDLVFIHGADTSGSTCGDAQGNRCIDNVTFYARLGQKIIHILNTHTPAGKLYEVDMRLRPSGNSGLLVASFSAFEKYQRESAWTWEHQALVRARAIAGMSELAERFKQLRRSVLTQVREPRKLQQDVVEMRSKMRAQLGSKKKQQELRQFHLKQDPGGIVDIEFMVQYAVLAWAHQYPALTEFTDNIRILEGLQACGQLSAQEVSQLIEAYKAYRSLGHRLALQQQPGIIAGDQVESERQVVTQIWQRLMDS